MISKQIDNDVTRFILNLKYAKTIIKTILPLINAPKTSANPINNKEYDTDIPNVYKENYIP
jgi:hypothetical protein